MSKHQDYDYFDKFVELVTYSYESALLLNEIANSYQPMQMPLHLKDMHKIEHNADLGKHEMMQHLAVEFIAPLEREDIVLLSQNIDYITDSIEDVLITMHMYNVTRVKPELKNFTSLIVSCCLSLVTAMKELHNFKKSKTLKTRLIEVNRLEEAADKLYYDTVHKLYQNVKDPIELFVWSALYAKLEKCTDACEHVADTLEGLIMKNT